ncbi:UUbiquitin carboxyl-terminal hydrolase FAM188B [Actinidia chinensis var. chinensis]|uniref:UUbiquitin carboxyl-terminal hydrolase FAM188B n=1 Tax=Actinidia chinensis var. chinensis TaxID=1590841 RepID=A0A2R6RP17_ACTCC|nr:UUbiquitin carboxyl-terminal hydrolase FAM188B [Actinidia chinensis var. chinensis]
MGNGYHHHQRSTFLPMLCSKPSTIKDAHLPPWQLRHRCSSTSADPSSPQISCIGQIKKNNRITATTSTIQYHKLKRLFSGKNLTPTPPRREMIISSARAVPKLGTYNDNYINDKVPVAEMDPPLPVVKRVAAAYEERGRDEVSLWKRRSGGAALRSLQVQPIHIPNNPPIPSV